ncbi:MAG: Hsp70 family protein [Desulfobacteraceae bacterium]|nr:MAG: Hsp70 family protein [Desulfobacteraceae bacterium]
MPEPAFIVGIDLGTTNSVVAFTESNASADEPSRIRLFKIPQLIGPGVVGDREILPSFVLIPGPHDVPEGGLALPWNPNPDLAVGEFARDRGAEIVHRIIGSAKSWLCHTGVDRKKPILPWDGPEDRPKLSPVEASAAVLEHIKNAWNHVFAEENDSMRLEHQEIYLTVPASFDAVARNLTVEAAQKAGLDQVILIEEPQAAFYAWIDVLQEKWRTRVEVGDLILVVDIGGGTSDFSLIAVSEERGELVLERIAVGEHLLIGGDNMDLTLAYAVANRMASEGKRLNPHQVRGLTHACRTAKEKLLADGIDAYPVAVLGRSSSLIGGTVKTELTRSEVENILTDGFFPKSEPTARPRETLRTGMREIGLAYASDPAITHHLAKFLHQKPDASGPATLARPTKILFNGGVMKAAPLRMRVLEILASWFHGDSRSPIAELESADYDRAVARGAAYYGLARRGKGIRIRGGLARTYYIGIEAALPAVPGMPAPVKALCVAPFGMEEGSATEIGAREFGLVVGEPVKFDFLGSTTRRQDATGVVVEDWEGEIEEITTLETKLEGEPGTVLPVSLEVRVTEIGTLELWCASRLDGRKFKLEFNVREQNGR